MEDKSGIRFIWPKEGYKGRSGHRGFRRGLSDIISGRGPDIFISNARNKNAPIPPDQWSNWDSYFYQPFHLMEEQGHRASILGGRSRGYERYDPHMRKYTAWERPSDYGGEHPYPRFTLEEVRRLQQDTQPGGIISPSKMGSDWTTMGPMRFRPEHAVFWGYAHRVGENRRQNLPLMEDPWPYYRFGQTQPEEIDVWARQRGICG